MQLSYPPAEGGPHGLCPPAPVEGGAVSLMRARQRSDGFQKSSCLADGYRRAHGALGSLCCFCALWRGLDRVRQWARMALTCYLSDLGHDPRNSEGRTP